MEDSTRITDPYIWVTDNLLSVRQCNNLIKKFEDNIHEARPGITGAGLQLHVKNSNDIVFNKSKVWARQDKQFHKLVTGMLEGYILHLKQAGDFPYFTTGEVFNCLPQGYGGNYTDTGYQMQKTDPGKGYVWHHDAESKRVMTFIVYLNDVEEGWTQFYNGDQVSPKPGRGVIFPATWTYVHQGYPPKQTKYLVTGWLHSA